LIQKTQTRFFSITALFLGAYALALSLSPAVIARSWQADLRWSHWIGYTVWLAGFSLVLRANRRRLTRRDPLLLPIVALLSGWGLLTIWRLSIYFGLRQTIWLTISLGALIGGMRLQKPLQALRRYKYLWLTGGLILTGLTLLFGTNPMGAGPRLWLGCCGVYLQPSEPLKLLLIIYLAAYFADWGATFRTENDQTDRLHALVPTLIMTGMALLLLIVQRDLGAATLFIFISSVMIYLATGWRWIPVFSLLGLGVAGAGGYLLFDVVRLRVDAWLNPWLDPSGRSYQIVQSLIAVANGGLLGRGPGLGSPSLVPVAHSDFIFAALAEESGLVGALGLLILIALIAHRGLHIALHAREPFHRYLAAGLTANIVAQSVLIIAGNLRLLPLTGVMLRFISYGGSSLLVSFLSVMLLAQIHNAETTSDLAPPVEPAPQASLGAALPGFLLAALIATALVAGWWGFYRGPDLLTRTDNPRRSIADRYVPRGALFDRFDTPLAETVGQPGEYSRYVHTPALSPVLGYNHPIYGQAGLEASLDPILRGLEGQDAFTIWQHHLLYGQPPPGLDVRLTLDLELQQQADALLGERAGAMVLIRADTGDILVMASHPFYNPNRLESQWESLIQDQRAPLVNRVMQGSYALPTESGLPFPEQIPVSWQEGLPLRLPGTEIPVAETEASPMGVALLASALNNDGVLTPPRLAQAYRHPEEGWIPMTPLGESRQLYSSIQANSFISEHTAEDESTWRLILAPEEEDLTWFVGGSIGDSAYVCVLVLEQKNLPLAEEIGTSMLVEAMSP